MNPLVYTLHSGNLYGTERMALVTLRAPQQDFHPLPYAPPGPIHPQARRFGIETYVFESPLELLRRLIPVFRSSRRLAFIATGVVHSLACVALSRMFGVHGAHLCAVHGGTDLVCDGIEGFLLSANDASELARQLTTLRGASPKGLESIALAARQLLATRCNPQERLQDYQELLEDCLGAI